MEFFDDSNKFQQVSALKKENFLLNSYEMKLIDVFSVYKPSGLITCLQWEYVFLNATYSWIKIFLFSCHKNIKH